MFEIGAGKCTPSAQKLRGGYYTPQSLADYLCGWAVRSPDDRILEPSCGDGSFVRSAARRLSASGSITAIELIPEEITRGKQSLADLVPQVEWRCGSFFDFAPQYLQNPSFDAVIGNPPFIRFQHFQKSERERAFELLRPFGYNPNGLANAWSAFVQLSAEMLRNDGCLAMVVPAELLQVQYAAELRHRLPYLFSDTYIIAFEELVFPEIQQEVILLLAKGRHRYRRHVGRLHALQVRNGESLITSGPFSDCAGRLPTCRTHDQMKWTSVFLDSDEFDVLEFALSSKVFSRLGEFASVDVGIVTGRNSFFVIDDEDTLTFESDHLMCDIVGRTSALKSIRFTRDDFSSYRRSFPSKLINLTGVNRPDFPHDLEGYIQAGEAEGVHTGYKCRIRSRWFDVPSVYTPDAFMHRQIHHAPLLVANHAGATSTDTIHRVRLAPSQDVEIEDLCGSLVNSVSLACSEVLGRSYGGGVLELEPREAERLPIPFSKNHQVDVDHLDEKLRTGDLEAALDHGDEVLLRKGCGLSKTDIRRARSAWRRLRDRRHSRKHRTGRKPTAPA